MDRLQPVLKQKFWILLVLGLSLTVTGWWMATSALAKTIGERTSSIESSFKLVGSSGSGVIPNESWAKKLNAINADQAASIESTKLSMWKRQRDRMTWPEGITPSAGYWGKFTNPQREIFRDCYEDEVRKVWKIVNPFNKNDGTGIVEYPLGNVFMVLRQKRWDVAPPDSEVMWTVREDLWLLECLFQTITSVNGGYEIGRGDACIHQIDRLELRGGGDKLKESGGGGGGGGGGLGGGGGGGGMEAGAFAMNPAAMGAMRNAIGGSGAVSEGLKMVTAEFDAAEEFGDDGSSAGGGRAAAAAFNQANLANMAGALAGIDPSGGGGGGGGQAPAAPEIKRYLIIDEKLPFKKRGFYLSLKMDHTKIPLLIAELTANERSVWPIEIMRVQMSRLNEDDATVGSKPGKPNLGMQLPPGLQIPKDALALIGAADRDNAANPFNDFGGNVTTGPAPEGASLMHALAMRAALENALRDPVMAQVTICGAFTLFKEVKEPEQPKPVAPPEDSAPKSPSTDDTTPPADPENTAAEPTMEPVTEATEAAAAAGDSVEAAAKAEADEMMENAEKPEPGEKPTGDEPKPESVEPK